MRLRVIVFDESQFMRQFLCAVLETRGYEVFAFADPGLCPLHVMERCLCPDSTLCADAIISDLRIPNVNGLDFLESLMMKGCRKPRFAITSRLLTEAEVDRARQLGCRVFMKPFHIDTICQWLEEIEPSIAPDRQLLNWYEHKWFEKGAG